jgi:hypothetical protein
MRWISRINTLLLAFLTLLFFSCKNELTPCECGRNISNSYDDIDQELELKCENYILNLSVEKRKIWNKQVLDCTSDK